MSQSAVITPGKAQAQTLDLRAKLRKSERARTLKSLMLIAPLFLFVLVCFAFPIGTLLTRSVDNPDVNTALPATTEALATWKGKTLPGELAYAALVTDLANAKEKGQIGALSKRLSYEIPAFRTVISKTLRNLPDSSVVSKRDALIAIDSAWGELNYWKALNQASSTFTPYFLLAALDHRIDSASGSIVKADPNQSIYVDIFARTFYIGGVVTILCLLLGFPVAYWLATLPEGKSNLLMICVLLPFWTSLIVRTAAWVVLLQSDGLINRSLLFLGVIDAPVQLVFNRTGVIIAMTHVLLPFMILPLYSVMKNIPTNYVRAAISLGAHPFVAFWRVYVPQTFAGLAAGALLTFILAIGYYVTPALVGGAADQMVSYFVAFYTNKTVNWGMASALGSLLLIATLLLYAVYGKLTNPNQARS
ncbi:ABC transporter permease [Pseudomonas sp. CCC3.1]|uniref:ABC transporter permease n=1 Tax=Pseudomonas sp. CCC3.1 TaxID=3048607 RepID=UPI002AC92A9A|nr:ABC transporter permease [Pseudomonas sp. CCC3.1]MEB0206165.1 ABC transporter permease [Pseudomonas sp. CCC3.1]WPX34480.1 ABC transporter permease [Pseudomonas sp. CCC3.1]